MTDKVYILKVTYSKLKEAVSALEANAKGISAEPLSKKLCFIDMDSLQPIALKEMLEGGVCEIEVLRVFEGGKE